MHESTVKTMGQGRPVILLHGLFGMSDNLMSVARALADDYFVVIPDAVNHGQARHQQGVDYDTMADDVVSLMLNMKIDSAAVLGHSMGGKTAMRLTQKQPQAVNCLLVADIAPVDYPPGHDAVFAAMRAVREKTADLRSRRDADDIMAEFVKEPAIRQFLLKNLKRDEQGQWQWMLGLDELVDSYAVITAAPELNRPYHAPALFIRGGESDYIQEKHLPVIKQYFPAAQILTIDGAGHWLHSQKPEEFNTLAKAFLEKNYVQD